MQFKSKRRISLSAVYLRAMARGRYVSGSGGSDWALTIEPVDVQGLAELWALHEYESNRTVMSLVLH
jgi:hypothetical protein